MGFCGKVKFVDFLIADDKTSWLVAQGNRLT